MKPLFIALYVCLLLVLSVATIVEQREGTEYVATHVYHTAWFCSLWGALALLTVGAMVKRRMWRTLPTFLLHLSFLIILSGALLTYLFGERGYLHLRVGRNVGTYMNEERTKLVRMPFKLQLDSFRIAYHDGTDAPSDYISYIRNHKPVSMNRILRKQGYRFHQASYDNDLQGSWLSVNHDPWGIRVTYTGYLLLGLSMILLLIPRKSYKSYKSYQSHKKVPPLWGLRGAVLLALLYQLFAFLRRWYEGGYVPLSNGYETIQFLALCSLLVACLYAFSPSLREREAAGKGSLYSCFALALFAIALLLSFTMDSDINPLMPVLSSPLLFLHVSVIIMAYALLLFLMLSGTAALLRPSSAPRLMQTSQRLLRPAVFLLCTGIFLGAVWANISWGRYWAWDPKEVWALVTLMLYALPIHSHSLTAFRRPKFFHAYVVAAFLAVLMTYFGVTYLLGGMHSYAR